MQKDFSYPVKMADINRQEQHFHLTADSDDLSALRDILKVEGAKSFCADIYMKHHVKEGLLDVWGSVSAVLELKSVISLENFDQAYDIPFEYHYDTRATYKDIRELEAGINDDVPDIIENGQIDLGAIALEQLALALDDYPRKEGETFSFVSEFDEETTLRTHPFAALEKLKK